MGFSKRQIDDQEAKDLRATRIAIEARVLSCCEIHHCVFEGNEEIVSAYKVGNALWSAGKIPEAFATRREMTDIIKDRVEYYAASRECPLCEKRQMNE